MPRFEYEATDATGMSIQARIEAANVMEAAEQLRAQGFQVTKLRELPNEAMPPAAGGMASGWLGEIAEAASDAMRNVENASRHRNKLGRTPDRPLTCGWCETVLMPPITVTNCPNCGGVLPLPPGPDRGPEPPTAPRKLPAKFVHKLRWGKWELWVGVALLCLGLSLALLTMCITMIFALVGGWMVWHHVQTSSRRLEALRFGQTAEGEIVHVGYDRSTSVNDKHPFKVEYRYDYGGNWRPGSISSWNQQLTDHYAGEPIWVVYVPNKTGCSSIWPPIG